MLRNRQSAFAGSFIQLLISSSLLAAIPSPAQERFPLRDGEVIVFAGGEEVVEMQRNGCLELCLTLAVPGQRMRFRYLGWEGDTVYEQPRQLNFPSWRQQLERVGATVVVAQFGGLEALQGRAAVSEFERAYDRLLNEFSGPAKDARRVVLLSPAPFERKDPPLPDLSSRNDDLAVYVEAVRRLAARRGHPFVDLFTALRRGASKPLTRDGLHLSPAGHWLAARETVRQLGWDLPRIEWDVATGKMTPPQFERLRGVIQRKNQLWFDYWRPMNWAFLHGDRTEQPSSRDHRNPKTRWFPAEMEEFIPLMAKEEAEIRVQSARWTAGGAARK